MRKNLLAAAASALAIVAVAGQAMADQIALGNNTPSGATAYSYVWEGGPILVTSAGFTGFNEAFGGGALAGDIGTYTFGSASFTIGPKVGTNFPIAAASQSLTVTMSDGDTATGTVTWTEVEGGSPPAIIGDWAITSSSGDLAWTSDFVPGLDLPAHHFTYPFRTRRPQVGTTLAPMLHGRLLCAHGTKWRNQTL